MQCTRHGLPCIAASQLPFTSLRLRWYSCDRCVAGPCSEACLSLVDTAEVAVCQVLCTVSAVQVEASFQHRPSGEKSSIMAQWRFQAVQVSQADEPGCSFSSLGEWCVLDHHIASSSDRRHFTGMDGTERRKVLIGEDEGLELGTFYVFSVRVSDGRRSSAWSACSRPVLFLAINASHANGNLSRTLYSFYSLSLSIYNVCWTHRVMNIGFSTSGSNRFMRRMWMIGRSYHELPKTSQDQYPAQHTHTHTLGNTTATGGVPGSTCQRLMRLFREDRHRTGTLETNSASQCECVRCVFRCLMMS